MIELLSLRQVDIAVVVLLVFFLYRLIKHSFLNPWRYPSPPGPKALPFIGNAHQIPAHYRWVTFTEWGKKYGTYALC